MNPNNWNRYHIYYDVTRIAIISLTPFLISDLIDAILPIATSWQDSFVYCCIERLNRSNFFGERDISRFETVASISSMRYKISGCQKNLNHPFSSSCAIKRWLALYFCNDDRGMTKQWHRDAIKPATPRVHSRDARAAVAATQLKFPRRSTHTKLADVSYL